MLLLKSLLFSSLCYIIYVVNAPYQVFWGETAPPNALILSHLSDFVSFVWFCLIPLRCLEATFYDCLLCCENTKQFLWQESPPGIFASIPFLLKIGVQQNIPERRKPAESFLSLARGSTWWAACLGSSVWGNLTTQPVTWAKGPWEHCLPSPVTLQDRKMSVTTERAVLCGPSHPSLFPLDSDPTGAPGSPGAKWCDHSEYHRESWSHSGPSSGEHGTCELRQIYQWF